MAIATAGFGLSISLRGRVIGPEAGSFFIGLAAVATAIAIPVVVFRIRSYFSLFQRGVPTTGVIVNGWFKGHIKYEYSYKGTKYLGRTITQNKAAAAFREGQEITLLVDPEKPTKAIIPVLYS